MQKVFVSCCNAGKPIQHMVRYLRPAHCDSVGGGACPPRRWSPKSLGKSTTRARFYHRVGLPAPALAALAVIYCWQETSNTCPTYSALTSHSHSTSLPPLHANSCHPTVGRCATLVSLASICYIIWFCCVSVNAVLKLVCCFFLSFVHVSSKWVIGDPNLVDGSQRV